MSINNDSLFIEGIIGSFEHTHIIGKLTLSRIDNSNGLIGKVVAAEYNAGSIGDPVDILLFQCSSLSRSSCNNRILMLSDGQLTCHFWAVLKIVHSLIQDSLLQRMS